MLSLPLSIKGMKELEKIKQGVERRAEEQDNTSPAPADSLDPGEFPVGVDSNEWEVAFWLIGANAPIIQNN
jgi:hypothetical protein